MKLSTVPPPCAAGVAESWYYVLINYYLSSMKKFILAGLLVFSFVILPVVGVAESEIERAINNLVSSGSISKQQAEEARKILGLPAVGGTYTAGGSSFCYNWTRNLVVGSTGPDVEALNEALSQEGIADRILSARSYYDEATASNVTRLQEKYRAEILTPNGFSSGTGNLGPATRAKLNLLYACGTLQAQPVASINVVSPNGRETLTAGQKHTITWSAPGFERNEEFVASYKKDGGINNIISRVRSRTLEWTVPSNLTPGSYKITVNSVSRGNVSDVSDNWFTVVAPGTTASPSITVTSPNGGPYEVGSVLQVNYSTTNLGNANVNIDVVDQLGSAVRNIVSNFNNSGVYTWIPTPGLVGTQWRIRVSAVGLSTVAFSPYFTITAPTVTTSYTLTTNVTGAGNVSGGGVSCGYGIGSSCTKSLNSGTQVTLSASPYSGYVFSGWSGACSGTGSCSITFDSNKSVSATFSVQTQSVTTSPSPIISSLSPASGPVGTTLTITGSNFTVGNNTIWLRGGTTNYSTTVNSTNGTSIQYTVPSWATGTYTISIERNDSLIESNTTTFTVTVSQVQTNAAASGTGVIALSSIVLDGTNIKARYSNNTGYSAHLVSEATGQIIGSVSFGSQGNNIEGSYPSAGTNVKIGDRVKICHGNNYGICSAVMAVTGPLSRGLVDFQKASVFQILREVLGL